MYRDSAGAIVFEAIRAVQVAIGTVNCFRNPRPAFREKKTLQVVGEDQPLLRITSYMQVIISYKVQVRLRLVHQG